MTPLFLALVLIEIADVIFAVDSVPAIFLITTDPFIVYTSNIFAILGLRALYFALAAMVHRFQVSEVRPVDPADLHRLEDLHRMGHGLGKVPACMGAWHHHRDPGERHSLQPLEDPRPGGTCEGLRGIDERTAAAFAAAVARLSRIPSFRGTTLDSRNRRCRPALASRRVGRLVHWGFGHACTGIRRVDSVSPPRRPSRGVRGGLCV
jgi:hypothetical protein